MSNKPFVIRHKEFEDRLEALINTSGLPMCAMLPVIRYATLQMEQVEAEQHSEAVRRYNEALNAAKEKDSGTETPPEQGVEMEEKT